MTLPHLDPNWHENFEFIAPEPDSWARNNMLYYLCRLNKVAVSVEIGIGSWVNGIHAFGQYALEKNSKHYSIDIYHGWCKRAEIIRDFYDYPIEIICADSTKVDLKEWINLCYVDGNHKYDGVVGDIKNFAPRIRRNGLMIFDDYGKKHHQVTEAVNEYYDPENWQMCVLPIMGWAIWRKL